MPRGEDFSPEMAAQAYLPLMHEFAIRSDLVARALDGKIGLNAPYAREFAYLQFRRMCELLALGCLFLHGDLPIAQSKALAKEWHAEKLLKLLHRQHPFAYPQPIIRTKTERGWSIVANNKPNALTYKQFQSLYSECGRVLHRGTVQTVQSAGSCSVGDYERTVMWQAKLVSLMNEHLITRATTRGWYVVSLRTQSGYPECSIFSPMVDREVAVHTVTLRVSDDLTHSYVSSA